LARKDKDLVRKKNLEEKTKAGLTETCFGLKKKSATGLLCKKKSASNDVRKQAPYKTPAELDRAQ
jgi:hypothetical protein